LASELRDAYEKLRNSAKATFDDLQMWFMISLDFFVTFILSQ
jgi:hypothetical protein